MTVYKKTWMYDMGCHVLDGELLFHMSLRTR